MHMTAKEVVAYSTIYIPWLRERHQDKSADLWQKLVDWNLISDDRLRKTVEEMLR
jgi:hypothetical protein